MKQSYFNCNEVVCSMYTTENLAIISNPECAVTMETGTAATEEINPDQSESRIQHINAYND